MKRKSRDISLHQLLLYGLNMDKLIKKDKKKIDKMMDSLVKKDIPRDKKIEKCDKEMMKKKKK